MFDKLSRRGFWFYVVVSLLLIVAVSHVVTNPFFEIIRAVVVWIIGGAVYRFARDEGIRMLGGFLMALAIAFAPSISWSTGITFWFHWVLILIGCYSFLGFAIVFGSNQKRTR